MSMVSWAMRRCLWGFWKSRVLMLCRRSASLTISTRMSWLMARIILRMFSACASSLFSKTIMLILVTPSTMSATSSPNLSSISSMVVPVSSTVSCSRPAATVGSSKPMSARV